MMCLQAPFNVQTLIGHYEKFGPSSFSLADKHRVGFAWQGVLAVAGLNLGGAFAIDAVLERFRGLNPTQER